MRLLEKAVPDDVCLICQRLLVNFLSALNLQSQKTAIRPLQVKAMKASAKNIPICSLRAGLTNFINIAVNRSLPAMQWLPSFKSPYEGNL
jgi:hypothetical protein